MVRRFMATAAISIAVPFGLAACGGDDESTGATASESPPSSEPASGGGGQTVAISATDFAFDPANPTVKAGAVTFNVTNDGKVVHEFEVEGNGFAKEVEDIEPGESAKLPVNLEPGTYELVCHLPGHEKAGMVGELTVE